MADLPGLVALFGSGETSSSGRRVYQWVFDRLVPPMRVAVLETPAGFQPNSALVAQKVADFLQFRLQNHRPEVAVLPARRRGSPFSPEDPALLAPMLRANLLFLGPGSPTYAVRQLHQTLAWGYLQARHRMGAGLLLASAATIAVGARALPVYEIYKVGEELHWQAGLDLFGPYGLSLVFVPHWNNNEGGTELDTSRCFMGLDRFRQLLALLPATATVVGIDEHTALVLDLAEGRCHVMGRGGVTLLRSGSESRQGSGQSFPMELLGPFHPITPEVGLSPESWGAAQAGAVLRAEPEAGPPSRVLALARTREEARVERDWATADALRAQIADQGWRILDTSEGPVLEPLLR